MSARRPGGAAALLAAAAVALAAAGSAAGPSGGGAADLAAHAGQTLTGLRLPLKRHASNGRVKELVVADRALVDDEGIVRADGRIQLIEFNEDGTTNSLAAGRSGFFDPKRNYAECHGPVAFLRPGVVLTGTNLVWNSSINILRIETNAVLRIERGGRSVVDAFAR